MLTNYRYIIYLMYNTSVFSSLRINSILFERKNDGSRSNIKKNNHVDSALQTVKCKNMCYNIFSKFYSS